MFSELKATLRTLMLLGVAALICICCERVGMACPTCKDGMVNAGVNHEGMVQGYFWSILFMMSMPFVILAGLCSYFYFEIRRARARGWQPSPLAAQAMAASAPPAKR